MATVTQVMRTCDVCGNAKDIETSTFGIDGKTYEIDLCAKDGKDLGKVAAGYISKARKATRQGQRRGGHGPRSRATAQLARGRDKAQRKESSGRSRATDSAQKEASASRSQPQKTKTADSGEKAKASRSQPQKAKAAPKQAARAPGVQQEKGIYVYGILPADIQVAPDQPGIGEHPGPLRVVSSDGLAALISEVDLSGQRGSPDDLRTYREILDATATEVPVFPLRFGTILTSEDAVIEELLTAHHGEFADALEQIEGCTEFRVKGRYVDADDLGEVTARREEDTRALAQAMKGVCVASVVREPAHELDAVDVAFLVARDEEDEMERVIEDLAREWDGWIDVQLIGPMAAYDFTGTAKRES